MLFERRETKRRNKKEKRKRETKKEQRKGFAFALAVDASMAVAEVGLNRDTGDKCGGGPPGPMPNPAVKPSRADGTAIRFAGE